MARSDRGEDTVSRRSSDGWSGGRAGHTRADDTLRRVAMRRWVLIACAGALLAPAAPARATTWSIVPSPNSSIDVHHLASVSVTSASDAWAVGWFRNTA